MNNRPSKSQVELSLIVGIALVAFVLELAIDPLTHRIQKVLHIESLIVTEIFTLSVVVSIGFIIFAWRRYRESSAMMENQEKLVEQASLYKIKTGQYRTFAEAVMKGNEDERARLARELHDDTIHQLTLLGQQVQLLKMNNAGEAAIAADLDQFSGEIDKTIEHIRQFIKELRPTYLEKLGLVPSLQALIKEKSKKSKLYIEWNQLGSVFRLDKNLELTLYRVCQTALRNVELHAEAKHAKLTVDFRPDFVYLQIEDDGKGFNVPSESDLFKKGHFGLIGMRERVELCNGSFELKSAIWDGTVITIKMPVQPQVSDPQAEPETRKPVENAV